MDLNLHLFPQLAVSQEEVEENFRRLGLLDVNVRFLKGWFIDTLPTAPIDKIAVLRLDGDLASSTLEALENLESKVSPGGFILVDDFNDIPQCKWAVEKYRKERNITAPIHEVDWTGIYWVKQ
jgi:O-methyltransferase